jgi:hypothetical protein
MESETVTAIVQNIELTIEHFCNAYNCSTVATTDREIAQANVNMLISHRMLDKFIEQVNSYQAMTA